MHKSKGDNGQQKVFYRVASSDAERTDRSSNITALSPMSCAIITPRRVVRTVKMSPAAVQLVQLDTTDNHSLLDILSVTALSEEVVDDLVSESNRVISAPKDVSQVAALNVGEPGVSGGRMVSFCTDSENKTNPHVTQLTNGYSCFSVSSLSPRSVESSISQEYTDVFDNESVTTCSWTCFGDGRQSVLSVNRSANQPATFGSLSQSISLVMDNIQKNQEGGMMVFASCRGSPNGVEWPRAKKIVNVRIEERIGRGCFGDVFRAVDLDTGLKIAVKEVLVAQDHSKDVEKQLSAMEREIRVMRKLNHKHIVNYYSARRDEGRSALLIYMEYVAGGTVGEKLRAGGPFIEDEARNFTRQLLEGLEYLHRQHIVHRDLKGDNLFLSEDGVLKLGDFGTSKELHTTLVTDSVAGTPNFMAPEVIACSGHSCMADIWSVGCCVLEMLTGHPPFWKLDNHMAVMFAVMKGRLEEQIPLHISEGAKNFIRLCARSDPKDRPTAKQLQEHYWLRGGCDSESSVSRAHSSLSLFSLPSLRDCVAKNNVVLNPKSSPISGDVFHDGMKAVVAVLPSGPNVVGPRRPTDLKRLEASPPEVSKLFSTKVTAGVSGPVKRAEDQNCSFTEAVPFSPKQPEETKLRAHAGNVSRGLLVRRGCSGGIGINNRFSCAGTGAGGGGQNNSVKSKRVTTLLPGRSRSRVKPANKDPHTLPRMEATVCLSR